MPVLPEPILAPERGPRPNNEVTVEVKLSAGNFIIFTDQLVGSASRLKCTRREEADSHPAVANDRGASPLSNEGGDAIVSGTA